MDQEDEDFSWTKDWRDPYDDMNDEEKKEVRQGFYDIYMYEIESAKTAKEFYQRISDLMKYVPDFNDQQIIRLAEIVKHVWKPKRGASTKEDRDRKIWLHWRMMNIDGREMSRQEMINYIMTEYKLTVDAATKIFNKIR
jgi:hypothetical protein